jgi:hypothetical protein
MNYKELSEVDAMDLNEHTYRLTLVHWVDDPTMDPDSRLYFKRKLCGALWRTQCQWFHPAKSRPPVPVFLHHPKSTQSTLETHPVVSEVSSIQDTLTVKPI